MSAFAETGPSSKPLSGAHCQDQDLSPLMDCELKNDMLRTYFRKMILAKI